SLEYPGPCVGTSMAVTVAGLDGPLILVVTSSETLDVDDKRLEPDKNPESFWENCESKDSPPWDWCTLGRAPLPPWTSPTAGCCFPKALGTSTPWLSPPMDHILP
ncbi:unnamed protein product, partial [Meganyctiphanes norvegica]